MFRAQNYKKIKKLQNFRAKKRIFAYVRQKQYLCSVKLIEYYMPVESMRGNLSGRQTLEYDAEGAKGYDVPVGQKVGAINYAPRIIAKRRERSRLNFFQVRTKSSVNMTTAYKRSIALMGGVGAMIAAILRDKTAYAYTETIKVWRAANDMNTYRGFLSDKIRPALVTGNTSINIGNYVDQNGTTVNVSLVNPWKEPDKTAWNVQITDASYDKFYSELNI